GIKLDAVCGIELARAERQPTLWRVAGEIILRQIGPINRGSGIVTDHDDATTEPAPPKHLSGGKAGCSSAHNHNSPHAVGRWQGLGFGLLALFFDEDSAGALLDFPALDRA